MSRIFRVDMMPPYLTDVRFRLRLLQIRQRTASSPFSEPPAATGMMWSAVRSVDLWGWVCQPGQVSPFVRRQLITARAWRWIWALKLASVPR